MNNKKDNCKTETEAIDELPTKTLNQVVGGRSGHHMPAQLVNSPAEVEKKSMRLQHESLQFLINNQDLNLNP